MPRCRDANAGLGQDKLGLAHPFQVGHQGLISRRDISGTVAGVMCVAYGVREAWAGTCKVL
jgi:hypothetical protein